MIGFGGYAFVRRAAALAAISRRINEIVHGKPDQSGYGAAVVQRTGHFRPFLDEPPNPR